MSGLFVGIDIGTSGVRAIAVNQDAEVVGQGAATMASFGPNHRDPNTWRKAAISAFEGMAKSLNVKDICAIAVDGTSGTVLGVDGKGEPQSEPMMYNDPVSDQAVLDAIAAYAPSACAALGQNSALARALQLQKRPEVTQIVHQADWISGQFSGRFDISDENNTLKTGYDPVLREWPDWIELSGMARKLLPQVFEPGMAMAVAEGALARHFGLLPQTLIVAGTTDGCASFLATGASKPGDAVTALGSTLTIKLLCETPVSAPQYGIYSHRLLGGWLAGGASNSGGNVVASLFSKEEVTRFTSMMNPDARTGLDLYPLTKPGERFPINDPAYPPRMVPRPPEDAVYFQALLEGIAQIEALGYQRLEELGAPGLTSLRTVGGGASNKAWSRIRQRCLGGVAFLSARSEEAAFGSALLAIDGARQADRA